MWDMKSTPVRSWLNEHIPTPSLGRDISSEQHLTQPIPLEEITIPTIDQEEALTSDIGSTWMTPIFYYLDNGVFPDDPLEAKKIVKKSFGYNVLDGWLYRRSFLRPWLKCITLEEGMAILIDIHKGLCGSHEGAQTIANKVLRQGYFWPSAMDDAKELVRKCKKSQEYNFIPQALVEKLSAIRSPWPFY
ncbi:uncharacterized protein LOC131175466 [Hevea brasiliensis]|uniref:uncharacterized protein LOC131175466 n=1 Tax=Hevea brasiliensis TaxID=3981 RepID=UPI0025F1EE37|nr:uncharacterized protein LOC131175466 [Hevea brasiliensis]